MIASNYLYRQTCICKAEGHKGELDSEFPIMHYSQANGYENHV